MEEEVTKVSLSRYKVELEQKQKYLKATQRYEEKVRDLRAALSYIVKLLDIEVENIPECFRVIHLGDSTSLKFTYESDGRRELYQGL